MIIFLSAMEIDFYIKVKKKLKKNAGKLGSEEKVNDVINSNVQTLPL